MGRQTRNACTPQLFPRAALLGRDPQPVARRGALGWQLLARQALGAGDTPQVNQGCSLPRCSLRLGDLMALSLIALRLLCHADVHPGPPAPRRSFRGCLRCVTACVTRLSPRHGVPSPAWPSLSPSSCSSAPTLCPGTPSPSFQACVLSTPYLLLSQGEGR